MDPLPDGQCSGARPVDPQLPSEQVIAIVDIHTHMVPSGDDGVFDADEGVELCLAAHRRGTRVLFATPHVWPGEGLSAAREGAVRRAHAGMAARLATKGLELRLGFELTPAPALLEEDPWRYELGGLGAVLLEVPFRGGLAATIALGEHVEQHGLRPVIAHPERSDATIADPELVRGFQERGWLVQVNGSSLTGRHGRTESEVGWALVEQGLADLVASDGHRASRPPFLDDALALARTRLDADAAEALFDGSALGLADAARPRVATA